MQRSEVNFSFKGREKLLVKLLPNTLATYLDNEISECSFIERNKLEEIGFSKEEIGLKSSVEIDVQLFRII